jgi:hypothetical protein
MNVAKAIEGIPVVASTTERAALYPVPATNQRVQNLATGAFERWDGVQWVADVSGLGTGTIYIKAAPYNADNTGGLSCVSPYQLAMAYLTSIGGGRLKIQGGTYLFNVTGDADTILIPSNTEIECDPGVVFKWGYWGSPLFAIVNKTNVHLKLNGAKFVWTGTFGTTAGSSDKFSYGRAIAAYEWCAHIACVGSDYVTIEDTQCAGNTTANNQNIFLHFRGKNDGSLSVGNTVKKVVADDVCQAIGWGEQSRFLIDDVRADRFSNSSAGLYGPAHVIYVVLGSTPSEQGTISNVYDEGTALGAFVTGSQTLSLKSLKKTRVTNIRSRRTEGVINLQNLQDVEIDFRHYTASAADDTGTGSVFFVDPTVANQHVKIRGVIVNEIQRDATGVNMAGITNPAMNLYCELDISYTRLTDGTEGNPAIAWCGNYGICTIRYRDNGNSRKNIVNVYGVSTDNDFFLHGSGVTPNPGVAIVAGGLRNTFYTEGDSTVDLDLAEFTPASGNAVVFRGARQYQSQKTIGTTTNPTTTIQLPKPGAYLLHVNLISSDKNHSRAALYWVVFDDAAVNDFTTAQLVGTQITKGGSAPSVLGITTDNAGLITLTSTAGSNTWLLLYGYRQLSAD